MNVNLISGENRVYKILEFVDNYCNDNGCDDGYDDLTLGDLEYLAEELEIGFDELVSILRESF